MINEEIITVEELAEDIDMLVIEQGANIKVTENFKKNGKCSYITRDLHMEVDDKLVSCHDSDDIILENQYVLMMFLRGGVMSIRRLINGEKRQGTIEFKDGCVLLEVLWNN